MKRVKKEKELFKVPKNVQDTIPVKRIWKNGIFLVGNNKYNKVFTIPENSYKFTRGSVRDCTVYYLKITD